MDERTRIAVQQAHSGPVRRTWIVSFTFFLLGLGVLMLVVAISARSGRVPDVSLIERPGCVALWRWDEVNTGPSMWRQADFYSSTPDRNRAVREPSLDYNSNLYDSFLRSFPGRDAAEYHRAFEECKDYIRWRDSG